MGSKNKNKIIKMKTSVKCVFHFRYWRFYFENFQDILYLYIIFEHMGGTFEAQHFWTFYLMSYFPSGFQLFHQNCCMWARSTLLSFFEMVLSSHAAIFQYFAKSSTGTLQVFSILSAAFFFCSANSSHLDLLALLAHLLNSENSSAYL